MNDLRTAAQQALEALEYIRSTTVWQADKHAANPAITALRAALAQPRQFTFTPKPPSPPPAPGGYDGAEAGLHPFSWRNNE
jgi:hypothetical protein